LIQIWWLPVGYTVVISLPKCTGCCSVKSAPNDSSHSTLHGFIEQCYEVGILEIVVIILEAMKITVLLKASVALE